MDSSIRKLTEDCSASKDIDEGLKCSESGLSISDHMKITHMPEINEIPLDLSIRKKAELNSTSKDIGGGLKFSESGLFTSDTMKVTQQQQEINEIHSHIGKSFERENIFKCEVCGKHFPCESELKSHSCGQTGETSHHSVCNELADKRQLEKCYSTQVDKKHKCTECNETSNCKSDLETHNVVHTGSKDHECPRCYRSYSSIWHLNMHSLKCTGETVQCAICNRFFSNESDLDIQSSSHTVVKPLKCDVCPKTFKFQSEFNTHYRIHTGDRPYRCSECNKNVSQKCTLNRHLSTHNK